MPRKASKVLTDGELKIMEVIWQLESASVKQVTGELQKKEPATYKTVQTMLRILEDKGYLEHSESGRTYIYKPLVGKGKARRAALNQLLASFFDGSPQTLMVNLIEDDALDADEIDQIKDLINKKNK